MFVIWLGAYTSLGLALFGGVMPEFANIGSAAGSLASITTRSYDFSVDGGSLDTAVSIGWRIFAAMFLVSALGSLAAYVSVPYLFHLAIGYMYI